MVNFLTRDAILGVVPNQRKRNPRSYAEHCEPKPLTDEPWKTMSPAHLKNSHSSNSRRALLQPRDPRRAHLNEVLLKWLQLCQILMNKLEETKTPAKKHACCSFLTSVSRITTWLFKTEVDGWESTKSRKVQELLRISSMAHGKVSRVSDGHVDFKTVSLPEVPVKSEAALSTLEAAVFCSFEARSSVCRRQMRKKVARTAHFSWKLTSHNNRPTRRRRQKTWKKNVREWPSSIGCKVIQTRAS